MHVKTGHEDCNFVLLLFTTYCHKFSCFISTTIYTLKKL